MTEITRSCKRPIIVAAFLFIAGVAQSVNATIQINFIESAPKDSFVIKNAGTCNLTDLTLEVDLSQSAGQLIFDTTATGAGVEVFQPFEVKTGNLRLVSASLVEDGDKSLSVVVKQLPPNSSVSFTIDVDDTLPKSSLGQIRVAGSEIEGAQVRLSNKNSLMLEAAFNSNQLATIDLPSCE